MCTLRTIEVKDAQTLNTTHRLLQSVWEAAPLNALLIPVWSEEEQLPIPTLLSNPGDITLSDPFAPVMSGNAARQAVQAMRSHQVGILGLCLRPCEIRSLKAILEAEALDYANVLLISSDCLGALPPEDYRQHLTLLKDHAQMTTETLSFAAQGGILPSRYQQSCQLCESPYPEKVDLHLQLFGHETHKQISLSWERTKFAGKLEDQLEFSDVVPEMDARRQKVLANLARWRSRSLDDRQELLDPVQVNAGALLEHLEHCSHCWDMLEAHCPTFDKPGMQINDEESLLSWLSTCGGCGMCDSICPTGYLLFEVILNLRQADIFSNPNSSTPL